MANSPAPIGEANSLLPRWAFVVLALTAASIGLASSAITTQFFVLGLERIEADEVAREVLIATGILMILTELMAFGLAALLPVHQLRALRTKLVVCGVMLLTFEAATIYITQVALIRTSDSVATAGSNRIENLQLSISNRRATADGLRANGKLQSASSNAWTRHLGALALRDALGEQKQIEHMADELSRLEATVRPTLSTVLGANGMVAYSVARALLISLMGLVMFAAAGALLREARSAVAASTSGINASTLTSTPVELKSTPKAEGKQSDISSAATLSSLPTLRYFTLPIAAMAVAPMAYSAQHAHAATEKTQDSTHARNPPQETPEQSIQSAIGAEPDDRRYLRVREGVVAGHIKPSVRGIQATEDCGTLVARHYLRQLEESGITERSGKGWAKKKATGQALIDSPEFASNTVS